MVVLTHDKPPFKVAGYVMYVQNKYDATNPIVIINGSE